MRRVVLASLPRLLDRILRDLLARQTDLFVAGTVRRLADLPATVASLRAEVAVVGLSGPDPDRVVAALRERHPSLIVVGLALRDDRGLVWPRGGEPRAFALSAEAVLRALRTSGRTRGGGRAMP